MTNLAADGYAYYQKIAGGHWKPIFDATNVKAINGLDLQTTLDINLQDVSRRHCTKP
jgi:cell division protein FtsI (penicillin-binding protein 3)